MAVGATKRKRNQRERDKKMGIKNVNVRLSANESADLSELCIVRGGDSGAFSEDEYISTLIREDKARLYKQLHENFCCDACSLTFPNGEHGRISHDASYYHPVGRKDLQIVTRHSPIINNNSHTS